MTIRTGAHAIWSALLLAGCVQIGLGNIVDTAATGDGALRPPDAEPGACYGRITRPALIETVISQVRRGLGDWRTETRQTILREREDIWFKTPCPEAQTPEFIASVQRALAVRGLYRGPVTGRWDAATRAAVRRYQQRELGLNSGQLSLEAGQRLGLIVIPREELMADRQTDDR